MSWTGSACQVPLKQPTLGLQETTLPAKVITTLKQKKPHSVLN